MSQASGAGAPVFAPGAAVAALHSLPHAGMLAVAQADGRLSLWDARHRPPIPTGICTATPTAICW